MELSVDNHHKAIWLSDKLTILVTSHESFVVNYGNVSGIIATYMVQCHIEYYTTKYNNRYVATQCNNRYVAT